MLYLFKEQEGATANNTCIYLGTRFTRSKCQTTQTCHSNGGGASRICKVSRRRRCM